MASSGLSAQIRAGGVIIYRLTVPERAIEFLLLQASSKKRHWTPPKGRVDPGEDELIAAIRETEEEAGLFTPRDYKFIESFKRSQEYTVNGRAKKVDYYLGEMTNCQAEVKLSHEHIDFAWLTLKRAFDHLHDYPDTKKMLQEAEDYVKAHLSN